MSESVPFNAEIKKLSRKLQGMNDEVAIFIPCKSSDVHVYTTHNWFPVDVHRREQGCATTLF